MDLLGLEMHKNQLTTSFNKTESTAELVSASVVSTRLSWWGWESRTPDTQFRKLLLYPSELQPRTLVYTRFVNALHRNARCFVDDAGRLITFDLCLAQVNHASTEARLRVRWMHQPEHFAIASGVIGGLAVFLVEMSSNSAGSDCDAAPKPRIRFPPNA